ncbi:MAG TPA: hypothetical protein VFY02_10625 [Gaiellaceae bacterium]|nr:hypothetical protein [Gaiellaceae bacterium]
MGRGLLTLVAIAVGIVLVLGVTALIGNRDEQGEPVTAGEWAQNVCGAVGVWRGEVEAIVEDLRTPNANATAGEEPQSETPQGRTGFIRKGLERGVQAAETLVVGVDNAGIPDTEEGEEAAERVSDWADSALSELEESEEALEDEAETIEESIQQLAEAGGTIAAVLASGTQTLVEVGRLDPELVAAFRDTTTCQQVRAERAE